MISRKLRKEIEEKIKEIEEPFKNVFDAGKLSKSTIQIKMLKWVLDR